MLIVCCNNLSEDIYLILMLFVKFINPINQHFPVSVVPEHPLNLLDLVIVHTSYPFLPNLWMSYIINLYQTGSSLNLPGLAARF